MYLKIIITLLSFTNGLFMLIDGFHVIIKGKYIGPQKPGPWANLFHYLEIDVFKLGPLFIFFGFCWLIWIYGIWSGQNWTFNFGLIVAILTLWYVPIGTLISIIIVGILFMFRKQMDL